MARVISGGTLWRLHMTKSKLQKWLGLLTIGQTDGSNCPPMTMMGSFYFRKLWKAEPDMNLDAPWLGWFPVGLGKAVPAIRCRDCLILPIRRAGLGNFLRCKIPAAAYARKCCGSNRRICIRPICPVRSTRGRNTLIFRKRWSVQNEVSSPQLLFIQTAF